MNPKSIAEFSLMASEKYLQSAVFIDDNIYNQATANPDAGDIEIRQPKPVMQASEMEKSPLANKAATTVPSEQANRPFRTKDLVGSFAKHGIVCALYEPERDFPTDEKSTIFNLCQTADLVILDWDFHEDGVQGTKPKALIEKLIKSGNSVAPHHVRLIAIYTNTPSLHMIASSLFDHLEKAGIKATPIECRYRIGAGSSRVIVLGKAGGAKRVNEEESFTVPERGLAGRLLQEFSLMNQGILPSCALLGMAAVRHSSARILDKFHGDLDAQFLLHRALIRGSEEAFDQLPELLGDEFKAVMEDAHYSPEDVEQFVREACSVIPVKSHVSPWKIGGRPGEEVLKEFWNNDSESTERLVGRKTPDSLDGAQPRKPVEALAAMCSVNDAEAQHKFAALLAIRTQYQTKYRGLGFGSIILDCNSGEYWVCVMPACDSIRLKGKTNFPFWNLTKSGNGHPVIIQCDEDKWIRLVFDIGKPSKYMRLAEFIPDDRRKIVMATRENGKEIFKSGNAKYEWLAQLKPSHAQRIANIIGQQLSRVGLTEAEWARMVFAKE
jgi:hypothetical protein